MKRQAFVLNLSLSVLAMLFATHAQAGTPAVLAASSPAVGGGAVSATIAGLSAASVRALPGFPLQAFRDGHRSGQVTLAYTVQADGAVTDVRVLDARPAVVFNRAATSMVTGWRFGPGIAPQARRVAIDYAAR
jgi:TonB family protein